jgi:hypothetical protein
VKRRGSNERRANPDTAFVPSIGVAVGHDIDAIARDLDHVDAASVTLKVYARVRADDEGGRERQRALVQGADWAPMGTNGASADPRAVLAADPTRAEPAHQQALP